ncbi:hypothetical protein WMY93_014297 [Mugilogobius chulae]|uniref:Uncharacterized protein n=1 Tax=Mugilogobius chulae TaxID=88201 RepID=A0AAW0P426_9GOBI
MVREICPLHLTLDPSMPLEHLLRSSDRRSAALGDPSPGMRAMSDALEQRVSEEAFGSDEGEEADVESYLEDNSSELMDRLRELEAENSALMLANESQREAYERCLDEVANHVVQALLNQKDLREECIKLKMLVCDLERQNRALCELFQQKLPNHPTTHYQVKRRRNEAKPHTTSCGGELKEEPAAGGETSWSEMRQDDEAADPGEDLRADQRIGWMCE